MEKEAGNISQEESSSPLNLSKEPVIKGKFVQDFTTKTLPDEPTPIFVGDSLKIFVQKVGFMRQKKFILEDHQFLVKVESLNDKPPLLSSILSVLETSLEQMLDNLRTFYKAEDQNLVYITIHQSEMESAMNSSAFEISTTSNHIILSHVLGMFNRFIRSNASLRLEKDFSVYFRVLSRAHVNDPSNRRGAIIREKFCKNKKHKFGCASDSGPCKRSGCFEIPIGYPQKPDAFKDKCLLLHIILGHYCYSQMYKLPTENNITFKELIKINSKNKNVQNRAGNLLESVMFELIAKFNFSLNGPYSFNDLVPVLADHYNCQIHLINGLEQREVNILSYPEIFDPSLHQIYLLSTLSNHVILVSNLKTFFNLNKKICFECKKCFSKNYFHTCHSKAMCHNCKSFYASLNTIDIPAVRFCDSQITKELLEPPLVCNKCEMVFVTHKCYNLHQPICRSRWHCQLCSRTIKIACKSSQQIKAEHVCGTTTKCKYCREEYADDDYHLCAIPKIKGDKYWPNLVFYQFAYQNLNASNCLQCFNLKQEYCDKNLLDFKDFRKQKLFGTILCPTHLTKSIGNHTPNACVLFRETSRGHFKQYTFCDDALLSDNKIKNGCDIHFTYSDSSVELPYQNVNVGGRKVGRSKDLTCKLELLEQKPQKTMLEKFLLLVTQREWENSVYISHQAQMINLPSILETFLTMGIKPSIIQKGSSLHSIEIEILKIKFLNGSSFFTGSVEEICKQFEIPFEPVYFPENFNCEENYNYSGPYPHVEQYFVFTDSKMDKEKKIKFYTDNNLEQDYFNFKDNLILYLTRQCRIFTFACLKFLKETLDFQVQLQTYLKIRDKKIIHPFGHKSSSISAFSFNQFAFYFLKDQNLFATKYDYTGGCQNVSTSEYEFACCYAFLYKDYDYKHAFNCANGQKSFGVLKVDLYSSVKKTVYNFHGCAFHYCDSCDVISKAKKNGNGEPVNHLKIPYSTLKLRDEKLKENLLGKYGTKVKEYKVMKECEWIKEKKEEPYWDCFITETNFIKNRPKNRLIPRICIRSGFLETYILRWQQNEFPNETFYHSDCNGLYPHICLTNDFPVGKYEVLLTNDLVNNITFALGQHFYKGKPLSGSAAHVRILAPTNLKKPFLSFRSTKEHNFMSLCRSCIEKDLNDVNKSVTKCLHRSENSRCFDSCWMISELDKAVSLGYVILEWFEIHFFAQKAPLLKTYVSILSALKLQNTGCDPNMTVEEKKLYCDAVNERLNVPEDFKITPTNICENLGKKQFYKSMLNNYLGKFIQNTQHSCFKFATSQHELEECCFDSKNEIVGIYPFSEDAVQVEFKPTLTNIKPSKKANLYIGAEIIAKARVHIYNCIEILEAANARIFFVDTDGIGYSLDNTIQNPLEFTNCTGDFKAVQTNIQSFHALGNRNYTIGYFDSSNTLKYDYKVKGVTLTSEHVSDSITPNLYQTFLDKHFMKEFDQIYLPQVKNQVDSADKKSTLTMHTVKFTNNLFVKRYIKPDVPVQTYETFPYGYKEL